MKLFEYKMIKLMLENTMNELIVAEKVANREISHLNYNEREKVLNHYKNFKKLITDFANANTLEDINIAFNSFILEKQQDDEKNNQVKLQNEETKKQLQIAKLKFSDQHVQNYQETQSQNRQLGELKDQYQNELRNHSLVLNYAAEWTAARTEQFSIKCTQKEEKSENQLKQYQTEIEREHKVHEELESFYSMKLGEYIQLLVDWVDKYERHKRDYDEKIFKLKIAHEKLSQKISDDKQLYASRQADIMAYEDIKEKRRLELMHLALLNEKAIKIQAWWKGMMVRCKLGPYKVKKGKSKGKSKQK